MEQRLTSMRSVSMGLQHLRNCVSETEWRRLSRHLFKITEFYFQGATRTKIAIQKLASVGIRHGLANYGPRTGFGSWVAVCLPFLCIRRTKIFLYYF